MITKAILNRNSIIILTERFLKIGTAALLSVFIARNLGANKYGQLTFLITLATMFGGISTMGADHLNVSELVKHNDKNDIFPTIAWSRVIFGLICILLLSITSIFYKYDLSLAFIVSFIVVSNSMNIYPQKIQAEGMYSLAALASLISIIIASFIKLYALLYNNSIYIFALGYAAEYILNIIICIIILKIKRIKYNWCCTDRKKIILFFKKCIPLILSTIIVTVYLKIDILLIAYYLDKKDLGVWSVSNLYIAPWIVLGSSLMPIINRELNLVRSNLVEYNLKIKKYISYIYVVGIFTVIINTAFSHFMLVYLFSNEYSKSIYLVPILSVGFIPNMLGILQDVSLAHRSKYNVVLKKIVISIPLSMFVMIILLNNFGLIGAAVGALIAQLFFNVLLNLYYDKEFLKYCVPYQAL